MELFTTCLEEMGGALKRFQWRDPLWSRHWKRAVKAATNVSHGLWGAGWWHREEEESETVMDISILSREKVNVVHLTCGIRHVTDLSLASLVRSFRSCDGRGRNMKHVFLQC